MTTFRATIIATAAVVATSLIGLAAPASATTAKPARITASFVTPAERSGRYDTLLVGESFSGRSGVLYACTFPTETVAYSGFQGAPVTTWTAKSPCPAIGAARHAAWATYTYAPATGITLTVHTAATYSCRQAHETDTYGNRNDPSSPSFGAFTLTLYCAP